MSLLVSDLLELLRPFKSLLNKRAPSPVYRALEIGPELVRGCSSFAMLETRMLVGEIAAPIYLDGATFFAILDSLPGDQEFVISADSGALSWKCGSARGKLALLSIDNMPIIPPFPKKKGGVKPTAELVDVLKMGALSCNPSSMASVGLHGVVLDNLDGAFVVMSSDNVTLSSASLGEPLEGAPAEASTLSPDAVNLLADIMADEGKIYFEGSDIWYVDGDTRAVFKQVAPLKQSLPDLLGRFDSAELVAPLEADKIAAFVKRVQALAESSKSTFVILHAQDGQLALSFSEASVGSDEFFLVEGLKVGGDLQIKLDGQVLARALPHVTEIVLDYLKKNAVIFRSAEGSGFLYLVSGSH